MELKEALRTAVAYVSQIESLTGRGEMPEAFLNNSDVAIKEEHSGEDCVCGQKSISKFYLYMPGTEKDSYEMGATITVGLGKEYYLPRCLTVPEGYAFKGWEMNPDPENAVRRLEALPDNRCFHALLPAQQTLLEIDPTDTYMSVWTENDEVLAMIRELAAAEGLFFRRAPDGP